MTLLPRRGIVISLKAFGPHLASTTRFRVIGHGCSMKGLTLMKGIFEALAPMVEFGASLAF